MEIRTSSQENDRGEGSLSDLIGQCRAKYGGTPARELYDPRVLALCSRAEEQARQLEARSVRPERRVA